MGHGIGMDVHERPFRLRGGPDTVLEAGMTFTDEPSIIVAGRFSVRIEDIVVCDGRWARADHFAPELIVNV